jgi:hydroxyacylglutathione hydrolase
MPRYSTFLLNAMTNSASQALSIETIPAFADNYLWLIHDGSSAAVVDPGDAAPVLAALRAHGLTLTAILLTHHHSDHTGGVAELLAHYPAVVFGPRKEAITGVARPLGQDDVIDVPGLDLRLSVLDVPGHTAGHIAYVRAADQHGPGWLFCGDTLFAGGCGRLFEGTPAQMMDSLGKLAALPGDTLVYCAHEYTLSNLRFAVAVEPDNAALRARVSREQAKRQDGVPTVPSTIAIERESNPFLRVTQAAIVASLEAAGKLAPGAAPVNAFAALRQWKNSF